MGTVYRKFCPHCDGGSESKATFDGFAGAVIGFPDRGGEILAEHYLAYRASDDTLIPLPHPIEEHALREQGDTFPNAARKGRLLEVTNLICSDCGAANTSARLAIGHAGCFSGLVLAAIMFAINKYLLTFPRFVEAMLVGMAILMPSLLFNRYIYSRYRDTAAKYRRKSCEQCNSPALISLRAASNQAVTCPRCKGKTLTCEIAGRS